jgi:imidazolonepropionase-like amidohydrolase
MGTVDVGKNADLVLLDANPVANAANLHQISAVIRAGRHYSSADLDRLKDRVRTTNPAT